MCHPEATTEDRKERPGRAVFFRCSRLTPGTSPFRGEQREGGAAVRSPVSHVRKPDPGRRRRPSHLSSVSADSETLDQRTVALDIDPTQVAEHVAAAADEDHETTTRVVVVLVELEVLRQVADATSQNRNLDLGRTRVALVGCVLIDDFLLDSGIQCH